MTEHDHAQKNTLFKNKRFAKKEGAKCVSAGAEMYTVQSDNTLAVVGRAYKLSKSIVAMEINLFIASERGSIHFI